MADTRYGTYLADVGALGRQAGIVGVYNKLARVDRVMLYFIPIPFVYLYTMSLFYFPVYVLSPICDVGLMGFLRLLLA